MSNYRSSIQAGRSSRPGSAGGFVYDHSTKNPRPKTSHAASTRTGRTYGPASWKDDELSTASITNRTSTRNPRPRTAAPRVSTRSTRIAREYEYEDDRYQTPYYEDDPSYASENQYRYGSSHASGHAGHIQAQRQTFRSAQASKQMVLEVYGNCITMLEEMESRELKHQGRSALSRSDIYLPSQTRFDDKAIQRKMETQLLLLQSQIQSCDAEIKDEVKEEMTDGTLQWMSARAAKRLGKGQTDEYAGKLFEVVQTGKTTHPDVFYKPPTIGERDMHGAMQALVIGSHKRDQLDEDFRTNRDKRASSLRLRPGSGRSLGAERMLEARPDLYSRLNGYVEDSLR